MAVTLGKRKTRDGEPASDGSEDENEMRARFQRAFEAKFKALDKPKRIPSTAQSLARDSEDDSEEDSDDSDWSGFDEDDEPEPEQVLVVDHHTARTDSELELLQKSQQRAFMSSKPPKSDDREAQPRTFQKSKTEDDSADAANVKNDLALQRLLSESHLLNPSTLSTNPNNALAGKAKLAALDLRLQGLGAKGSLGAQQKMPIAHRKGIETKAADREGKRRKEAKENGVILEKFRSGPKDSKRKVKGSGERRERGVGGPTVGKFRGGTLKLSEKDVRAVQGPPGKQRRKGKAGSLKF